MPMLSIERIQENPLSVEVKKRMHNPGDPDNGESKNIIYYFAREACRKDHR